MPIFLRRPWHVAERLVTDQRFVVDRREAMKRGVAMVGALALGATSGNGCTASAGSPSPKKEPRIFKAPSGIYPVKRNAGFKVDERPVSPEAIATGYNNFYEFTTDKEDVKNRVGRFETDPWSIEVSGLCKKPKRFELGELLRAMPLEERVYRFRCVEAWSMTVPWTGFPLRALIERVEPLGSAKYVRFVSFKNEDWAPGQREQRWYPWPYFEGMEMKEATHELTLLVTGMYGRDLTRQNGAPVRLIAPWKYGYKSAKSIVRIELVEEEPPTFWNKLAPDEYGFYSNVDPTTPHPRWSQRTERLIDTGERILTQAYNGYGEWVASLYPPLPDGKKRF